MFMGKKNAEFKVSPLECFHHMYTLRAQTEENTKNKTITLSSA